MSVDERILKLVVIGWLIGVAALALRVSGGFVTLSQLKHSGHLPVPEELQARLVALAERMKMRSVPLLYLSSRVTVPTVIGAFRGIVLLPASVVTGMSREMLETILVHELAHVARFDFLINAFQSVIEVVLFYHPAVWWVSQRIREERENCCDDLVIATLSDRKTYAQALTTLAELRGHSLAVRADGGELLVRIRRILGETPMKSIVSPVPVAILLGALILIPALQSYAAPPVPPVQPQKKASPSSDRKVKITEKKVVEKTTPVSKIKSEDVVKTAIREVPMKAVRSQDVAKAAIREIPALNPSDGRDAEKRSAVARDPAMAKLPSPDRVANPTISEVAKTTDTRPETQGKDSRYYLKLQIEMEIDSLLEFRKQVMALQRTLEMDIMEVEMQIESHSRTFPKDGDKATQKAWEAKLESLQSNRQGMEATQNVLERRLQLNEDRIANLRSRLEAASGK